ncbi:MAG: siphovirus Gp157 family protein [Treponema sp.]|nr:siphovirus Gp157 family protein [Treponema sp.]
MTIYSIADDYRALESLINALTDPETGETRDLSEDEKKQFTIWANEIEGNFQDKFDGIYKVYCNKKAEAEIAEAEKSSLKAEMDRLRKRADARTNEAGRLKSLIVYAMDTLNLKKIKTNIFSAGFQATAKSAKQVEGFFNPDKIPPEFLKRELSASAVKKAVDEGRLYEKDDPICRGSLFYCNDCGFEEKLEGVSYLGGETLVIR